MEPTEAERLLKNLDRRVERIEQFLPTRAGSDELAPLVTQEAFDKAMARLATREELAAAVAPLATKEELRGLATKDDLRELSTKEELRMLATKEELRTLATKEELRTLATKEELRGLATKEDLRELATKEELRTLATKEELRGLATKEEVRPLATRAELELAFAALDACIREEGSRTRAHFDAFAKRMHDELHLIAEGQTTLERRAGQADKTLEKHDKRLVKLETAAAAAKRAKKR